MRTALVLMTILGCDDTATDCQHVATLQQRWTSIELCDAESETKLGDFVNASYPVIVAVCQTPEEPQSGLAKVEPQTPDTSTLAPALAPQEEQTLTQKAITRVRRILPSTEGVKEVLGKPVRMVEDSYSWIARRLSN